MIVQPACAVGSWAERLRSSSPEIAKALPIPRRYETWRNITKHLIDETLYSLKHVVASHLNHHFWCLLWTGDGLIIKRRHIWVNRSWRWRGPVGAQDLLLVGPSTEKPSLPLRTLSERYERCHGFVPVMIQSSKSLELGAFQLGISRCIFFCDLEDPLGRAHGQFPWPITGVSLWMDSLLVQQPSWWRR